MLSFFDALFVVSIQNAVAHVPLPRKGPALEKLARFTKINLRPIMNYFGEISDCGTDSTIHSHLAHL